MSGKGRVEENKDRKGEKEAAVAGAEVYFPQKRFQLDASARPRARNWAAAAAFRGLAQTSH